MEQLQFNEFRDKLLDYMSNYHPEYEWSCHTVLKNNDIELTGILGKTPEDIITPTMYIDDWYNYYIESNMTFHAAATMIDNKYMELMQHHKPEVDLESFADWQQAKDKIIFRIVSKNHNENLLKNIPHQILGADLAVTYRYMAMKDAEGIGSCLIDNEMIKKWNVSAEQLHTVALDNTREAFSLTIRNITDIILELYRKQMAEIPGLIPEEEMEVIERELSNTPYNMMVASNEMGTNGASVLLYPEFQKWIEETYGDNAIIIPSSIHELIVVPENDACSVDELKELVMTVNGSMLSQDEILSDSVYRMSNHQIINVTQYDNEIDSIIERMMEEPPEPDLGPEMM